MISTQTCAFCIAVTVTAVQAYARCTAMRLQRLLLRRMTSLGDVIRRCSRSNHSGSPSYVHGTSSLPLCGSTIGELLQQRAEQTPHHEAVVVCQQNARLTFQQLLQLV